MHQRFHNMKNFTPPKRVLYILSQPHQPFFAIGVFSAIIFMLLFALSYKGILSINPLILHGYSMIFMVFTNFFYGFTLTTFPRFSMRPAIEPKRYLRVLLLNILALVTFVASFWIDILFVATNIVVALSFAYILKIFYEIYLQANEPKSDQYMIIVAFGMGALSNILYLLGSIPCNNCKSDIFIHYGAMVGVYLYLILLSSVIAFRMIPFFSNSIRYQKSSWFHKSIAILLILHIVLDTILPKWIWLPDLILSIVFTYEIAKMNLPFPNPNPLLWGLHIAIFWLPLGFLTGSAVEFFEAFYGYQSLQMPIHLLVVGFLTSVLIAFGTRVTLGHSGAGLQLTKAGKYLFVFVQIVVLFRVILSLNYSISSNIGWIFDTTILLWIVLFVAWSIMYGKILLFGLKDER